MNPNDEPARLLPELEKIIKRKPGKPAELELAVLEAMVPIIKKYKPSYMSKDRIAGIIECTLIEIKNIYLYGDK